MEKKRKNLKLIFLRRKFKIIFLLKLFFLANKQKGRIKDETLFDLIFLKNLQKKYSIEKF